MNKTGNALQQKHIRMDHSAVKSLDALEHELEDVLTLRFAHIAVALRAMLWQQCTLTNISPIQGQILVFCLQNPPKYCRIGFLAKEFSMTKPTISDAVKTLEKKQLLIKENDPEDLRSFNLMLTERGLAIAKQVITYAQPFTSLLAGLPNSRKTQLESTLNQLLVQLKEHGILNAQRSCIACQYGIKQHSNRGYACTYLNNKFGLHEVRLNCPYFQAAPTEMAKLE